MHNVNVAQFTLSLARYKVLAVNWQCVLSETSYSSNHSDCASVLTLDITIYTSLADFPVGNKLLIILVAVHPSVIMAGSEASRGNVTYCVCLRNSEKKEVYVSVVLISSI